MSWTQLFTYITSLQRIRRAPSMPSTCLLFLHMGSEGWVTCLCQLPARACLRAGAIPDWHKRAWRRRYLLSMYILTFLVSLVSTQHRTQPLDCVCWSADALIITPVRLSLLLPPQLLDPQGRHRPRVLRPSLRKSSPPSSPAAWFLQLLYSPTTHRRRLRHASTFAQLQLSGIHVLRTPPAPHAPPPIHPSIHLREVYFGHLDVGYMALAPRPKLSSTEKLSTLPSAVCTSRDYLHRRYRLPCYAHPP